MVAAPVVNPDLRLRLSLMAKARKRDIWAASRRESQTSPNGDWRVWLLMAGRGFGKTRVGAEWIRERVMAGDRRLALVGATFADVRDTMVEGESGVIACAARYGLRAKHVISKQRVEFSNGALAFTYSADEPDRLRGPQHEGAWADEIGTWRYGEEAWSNLDFGLRLGTDPRIVATSTPRVVKLVKDLTKRADAGDQDVVLTRGTTWENRDNIPASTLRSWEQKYGGTRLGRQELEGELLEDVEGALWTLDRIDRSRIVIPEGKTYLDVLPEGVSLVVCVVGIDPAATSRQESNETGIVVVARGSDGDGYVLADYSLRGSPNQWGGAAIQAYRDYKADHVTPETNNGGEMVTNTLQTIEPNLPINPVHASRGKATRAEPISALYEQNRVHHLGTFPELEDQMSTWVPGMVSPDRMDALVWGMTDVMLGADGEFTALPTTTTDALSGWFDE